MDSVATYVVSDVDPDDLRARIRSLLPTLSPALARVAEVVLAEPAQVATSTLVNLAGRTHVSEATVVRAARALGFSGYPQLRLSLAASMGARKVDRPAIGEVEPDDSPRDVLDKLAEIEGQAIRETAAHMKTSSLEAATGALAAARRCLAYGAGASGLVAEDLQVKLTRIGVHCSAPVDLHLAITEAALLGEQDIVIVVSDAGNTTDALEVAAEARRGQVPLIAITSTGDSPLARLADHVLIGSGHDSIFRPGALSSRISHLLIVDCLFICVARERGSDALDALARTRRALQGRRLSTNRGSFGG